MKQEAPMQLHDHDLLYEIASIAAHLGVTPRQAKHLISKGVIPTFKAGRIVCASKSAVAGAIASRHAASTGGRADG
jgi:hypothetical protein